MNTRPNEPQDERPEPWLQGALDSVEPPRARPAFRDALRARFIASDAAAGAGSDELVELEPLESADGADASNESAAGPKALRPAPARPGKVHSGKTRRASKSRDDESAPRQRRFGPWIAGVAFAAAAALAILFFAPTRAARVELVDSRVASLTLDGAAVSDGADLVQRLKVGSKLETASETVRLRLDQAVLVELAEGTRLSLVTWDEAPDGETVLDLASGGVRVLTGPGFAPRRLRVRSPDAEVAIVGTEFGVDVVEGAGTCVCCTHGVIAVTPNGRDKADKIVEGGMSFCFSSGAAPMLGDAKEQHASDVTKLRRYW